MISYVMGHGGPAVELATKYGPMQVFILNANDVRLEAGTLGSSGQDAVFTYQGKHYRAYGNVASVSGEFCTFRRDDRSPACGHTRRHNHGDPWFRAAGSPGVSKLLRREMVEVLGLFLETEDAATLLALAEANSIARKLESAEKQASDMRATLHKLDGIIRASRTQLADMLIQRGDEFRSIPDVREIIQRTQLPAGCHTPVHPVDHLDARPA